jgi:hypothetical protein
MAVWTRLVVLLVALVALAGGSTLAQDESAFRNVPMADRPWAYWWWLNGNMDRATITADLEAMKRLGFGGLLMFDARGYHDDGGHLHIPEPANEFMDGPWRELLAFSIQEAGRLGLTMSVNLSSHAGALRGPWPVGGDAPKRLVCRVSPIAAPGRLDMGLAPPSGFAHYGDVAVFAIRYAGAPLSDPGSWLNAGDGLYSMEATSGRRVDTQKVTETREAVEVVDLTGRAAPDGRLAWDVPEGQWALVRLGQATIDGHDFDVDVLDPKAVEGHFNRMGRAMLDLAGPRAGKTLTHFYSVSWEGAVPTWTGAFEGEFRRYRGYELRPWLPVLAGFTVESPEASGRFITDYRRARNECFRDHFYGTLQRLCHDNGLQWHAESGGPWVRTPAVFGEADQLAFLARTDMPQGEFWFMDRPDGERSRQLSRAQAMTAHTYGRPLAAAEAFTHMARHWSVYPAVLKRSADESFIDGVNHLIWHTFTGSPERFGVPGSEYFAGTHINRNVTWHNQAGPFVTYLGRCQTLLRRGQFVADVAAYVGDVPYQHWGRYTRKWSDQATLELSEGYAYDVFTTEVLLHRATVQNGRIVLPDGMSYAVLTVDLDTPQASPEMLAKIEALKAAGATVVVGQRKPTGAAGLGAKDDEVRAIADRLWSDPTTLADALKVRAPRPDFEGPFAYTHRQVGESDIYFVAGTGRAECIFRTSSRQPELWDPVTGRIDVPAAWDTTADGRTRVRLDLPPEGSVFVVFRKPGSPFQGGAPAPQSRSDLAIEGPWDLTFPPGRGAPERVTLETLVDWTSHADPGIRHFSGTATYRKSIELTDESARGPAVLELGHVSALAQVRINGRDLGVVWTAPWSVEVPAGLLRVGANTLEIEVTNTWSNRLIGDAALPPEQRITRSNLALEKGPRTLKPYQGYASDDPLQPSGLRGAVRLVFGR